MTLTYSVRLNWSLEVNLPNARLTPLVTTTGVVVVVPSVAVVDGEEAVLLVDRLAAFLSSRDCQHLTSSAVRSS
mgnify:CR=1 FL=1